MLKPVRRLRTGQYAVASWDDRLNVVGGLSYAVRRRLVAAIRDGLGGNHDAHEPISTEYAMWAGLEALARLMERYKLGWNRARGGARGLAVRDLIPDELQPPGLDGRKLPRAVARARDALANRLFAEGVFVTSGVLRRLVWRQLAGTAPGRMVILADGSRLTHVSVARVLAYYGVADVAHNGRARGMRVRYWDLAKLDQFMSNAPGLDLRGLAWAKDRYRVV